MGRNDEFLGAVKGLVDEIIDLAQQVDPSKPPRTEGTHDYSPKPRTPYKQSSQGLIDYFLSNLDLARDGQFNTSVVDKQCKDKSDKYRQALVAVTKIITLVYGAREEGISSEANPPEALRREIANDRYSAMKSDPDWHKLLRSLVVIAEYETDREKPEKPSIYASKEWFCDFLVEHYSLSGENRPHPIYGVYVLLGANSLDGAIKFIKGNMKSGDSNEFDREIYTISAIVGNAITNDNTPIENYKKKIESLGDIPNYSMTQALRDIENGRAKKNAENESSQQGANDAISDSDRQARQSDIPASVAQPGQIDDNNKSDESLEYSDFRPTIDKLIQTFSDPISMARALENHFGKNT